MLNLLIKKRSGIAIGMIILGLTSLTCPQNASGQSVRVLTYNTHLLTPTLKCGDEPTPECLMGPLGENTKQAAKRIASVLQSDYFDVVALNEVWDEDDGKAVLVEELKDTYSHYVKYVDVFGGGVEEDSGLMLFSKFAFEPLPDSFYVSTDNQGSYGENSSRIAFVKFDDCMDSDCGAGKGAVLVRLKHDTTDRIINVVVTHLNADYSGSNYSSTRNKQLKQIVGVCEQGSMQLTNLVYRTLRPSLSTGESFCSWTNSQWLLLMGDLNIQGQGGVGHALYPDNTPATNFPSEWWNKIGVRATEATTTGYPLYDTWAETSSETDMGFTHGTERLDYILAARRTRTIAVATFPDLCVQHVWNPAELEGLSDHRPLAADLNLEAQQCNPRSAHVLTPEELGAVGVDQGKFAVNLHGQLKYPGSVQWWRLEEGGTYTVALKPEAVAQGVKFDVYDAENMSSALGGSYQLGSDNMKACYRYNQSHGKYDRCENVTGEKFASPKGPIFIKVFNPNRDWSGIYSIAIHRHTCKLQSDSCYLFPNAPTSFKFPIAQLNDSDIAWFDLDIQHQADSGNPQKLRFYAENAGTTPWTIPTVVLRDENGAALSEIGGQPLSEQHASNTPSGAERIAREGQTGTNAKYFMTVRRINSFQDLDLRVGWQTNLMLFGGTNVAPEPGPTQQRGKPGAHLVCDDETNPEGGWDEITLQVNVDNTGWQTRGQSDFDCDNAADPRDWNSRLGLIRYLDSVQVRLIEVDENAEDDKSEIWAYGAWDMDTDALSVAENVAQPAHPYSFADGHYTFYFYAGKWTK
ncbi:MAG: endonuclease/exonuclease/phosphatase family protein [Desulfobulbaceae bacterium]